MEIFNFLKGFIKPKLSKASLKVVEKDRNTSNDSFMQPKKYYPSYPCVHHVFKQAISPA